MELFWDWNRRSPIWSILIISALVVAINCYPVIFCGRSFVAATSSDGRLVHDWWPPIAGMEQWPKPTPEVIASTHGSDTAATMLWVVPIGYIESRSVWQHGELPLWDRYGHAGATLIGQALSMLGDPLQWIVILGGGSAWTWDIKYLTVKFLFSVGFGLLARRLFKNGPLSLIFCAMGAYCGAFSYINSHPVFFVLGYAPWILLSAMEWLDLQAINPARWMAVWLLVNFSCFNAGHIEVAVILIGGLNLAALADAWLQSGTRGAWMRITVRMAAGTILFLGLTAPMWITFLTALSGSFTSHAAVRVGQLSWRILPGVFDDVFYLWLRPDDLANALAPGSSLLVLAGCCLAVSSWRSIKGESFFGVNNAAIVLWGGCVFGWVPQGVLAMVPFVNRVGHNGTDFSYLLILHLTILCGYGFAALIRSGQNTKWRNFVWMTLVFAVVFGWYEMGYWHRPLPWNYFLAAIAGAIGAPWLFVLLEKRRWHLSVAGWALIVGLGFLPNLRFGLYTFGDDKILMRPAMRVALDTPDKSMEWIKATNAEPFRVVGMKSCMMGDYPAVFGLEDIRSCAPVSSMEYIDLVKNCPGLEITNDWMLKVLYPVAAQPILNLLNVKYLLNRPDIALPPQIDFQVVNRDGLGVVENKEAWPRAFFCSSVMRIASNADFIRELYANSRQPFIAVTPDEMKELPKHVLPAVRPTNCTVATGYVLKPNTTEFDIHAPTAGVACLTEAQGKDFTVTVNGEDQTLLTVNRAFKGVYLDKAGDYHIRFAYCPRYWRPACAVFWLSLLCVARCIWWETKQKKRILLTKPI